MYVCSHCSLEKSDEDFYWHKNGGRKSSMCKNCYIQSRKDYNSEWREQNADYIKESAAKKYNSEKRLEIHYKKEYDITLSDYDKMYAYQDGKCAICHGTDTKTPKNGRFCVDHDHDTGKVRGLLCASCNRGIGLLKDDPETVLSAYKYLMEKW